MITLTRRVVRRSLGVLTLLLLAAPAAAQTIVQLGDPARSGSIAAPGQSLGYAFQASQGDTVRITFCSQSSGTPRYYYHQLELRQGATVIGSPIQGLGTLTATLPATGYYTISVRARNNQSVGWFDFQLDRLNDPVTADRMALDWNLRGDIAARAAFEVYTLRAEAGSVAELSITSRSSGTPRFYYHYVELVDDTGTQVATVAGNGLTTVTFQNTGVYTLFVAARNYELTGWYAASLRCLSRPGLPCDTVARASNYGDGVAGTLGVPTLTATAPPRLGTTIGVDVGNSYGQPTLALLPFGLSSDKAPLPTGYEGDLLVQQPAILTLMPLPAAGTTLSYYIPNDTYLLGVALAAQTVVIDPGATTGVALSRGLMVLVGR